jgi:hypothetical protein
MGECDRLKSYISDYLENSLDPSSHQEFENALKNSVELRALTNRVRGLKSHLGNLTSYSCSDDFSLKLREKIHSTPQPVLSRQMMVRFSFAASFIIILVVVFITLNNLPDSRESSLPVQRTSNLQYETPNPVSNPAASSNPDILKNDGETEVNTKTTQQIFDDSSKVYQLPDSRQDEPLIKHVDQKK